MVYILFYILDHPFKFYSDFLSWKSKDYRGKFILEQKDEERT